MIIKDRTKVLRAHAEEQAAACMADFEKQMATVYTFDQDEVWQKATRGSAARGAGKPRDHRQALQGAGHPADLRAVDQRQLARPGREHAGDAPHRAAPRGQVIHRRR